MVYQILIVLDQITPKIWRRVFVHEDTLLFDFHIIIQIAMGWENCHLHQFIKEGKYYSEKPENDNFWDDSHNVDYTGMTIGDLLKKKGDTIIYEYDFGDSWIHTLTLEAIHNSANTSTQVPLCIAGERPCPDEDSGGPFLYKPPRGKVKKDIGLNAINYMLSDDYYKEKEIKAEMAGPDFSAGESAGSAQGADPATGRYPGKDSGSEQDASSAINADNENFTYKEILLNTMTKAQIVAVARSFKMRIKASANKETCAEFVERELQQNPRLLRNALSYNELRALYLLLKNVKDSKTSRVQVPGGDQSPGADWSQVAGNDAAQSPSADWSQVAGNDAAQSPDYEPIESLTQELYPDFSIDDLEGLLMQGLMTLKFSADPSALPFLCPKNMKNHLLPQLQICLKDRGLKKKYHIENLLIGILTHYGALPLKTIEALINQHLPEPLPLPDLLEYFKSCRLCRKYNTTYSRRNLLYFYCDHIPSVKPLIESIEQKPDLEYATFKESELIQASEGLYYYQNAFSQRLLRHLTKFNLPNPDMLMHEIWVNIQIETPPDLLLEFISEILEFDKLLDLQEIMRHISDYQKHIPRWTLKGNVPGALNKVDMPGGNSKPAAYFGRPGGGGSGGAGGAGAGSAGGAGGAGGSGGSGAGGADAEAYSGGAGGAGGAGAGAGAGAGSAGGAGGVSGADGPVPFIYPVFTHQPDPNDPCPCGSGKKFKNCCGNN
jgi:hypothetical protein